MIAEQLRQADVRAVLGDEEEVVGHLAARRQVAAHLGHPLDVAAQVDLLLEERLARRAVLVGLVRMADRVPLGQFVGRDQIGHGNHLAMNRRLVQRFPTATGGNLAEAPRRANLCGVQDRNAGDVDNFLELGLLHWLVAPSFESPPVRLGISWYRVPDDSSDADGKHDEYLDPTSESGAALRPLDPRLYDGLASVVASGERSIESLGVAGVLPFDARMFDDELTFAGLETRTERAAFRVDWLSRALAELAGCAVVYFDPDNGLRRSDHKRPRGVPRRSSTPISTSSPRSSGAARASSFPTTSTRRTRSASRSGA